MSSPSEQPTSGTIRFAFKAMETVEETLYVSGPVLIPEVFDGQNEIVDAPIVKKIMRKFMDAYQKGLALLADHHGVEGKAIGDPGTLDFWISESYQSKTLETRGDTEYPIGTWFMEWGIDEADSKEMVLSGERNGFSIGGVGYYEELDD